MVWASSPREFEVYSKGLMAIPRDWGVLQRSEGCLKGPRATLRAHRLFKIKRKQGSSKDYDTTSISSSSSAGIASAGHIVRANRIIICSHH